MSINGSCASILCYFGNNMCVICCIICIYVLLTKFNYNIVYFVQFTIIL